MESLASLTPTLCSLFGVAPPALCRCPVLAPVVDAAARAFRGAPAEKCLLFAPDAIGLGLYRDYAEEFEEARRYAPSEIALRSVYPPKTPVCFASMFTGAPPEAHGIVTYEKPVLRCDTLFDALLRAGRRLALVAVAGSSMDSIFRDRALTYFSEEYDAEVTARAAALVAAGEHDVVVAYQQEYDDLLHASTPRSPEALQAVRRHVAAFATLAEAADRHWAASNRLLLWTPDHGAHLDPATGKGTHGDDFDDDMEVIHLYGFSPAARQQEIPAFSG
jgi:hypothetical protein